LNGADHESLVHLALFRRHLIVGSVPISGYHESVRDQSRGTPLQPVLITQV
jgi:hypothetical protein